MIAGLLYNMMTHTPLPIAGKLPIKTFVARQLPTKTHAYPSTHDNINIYMHMLAIYTPILPAQADQLQY